MAHLLRSVTQTAPWKTQITGSVVTEIWWQNYQIPLFFLKQKCEMLKKNPHIQIRFLTPIQDHKKVIFKTANFQCRLKNKALFKTAFKFTQFSRSVGTVSNIRRAKSQNLNVSRLVLQLYLPNSLKPDVKLRAVTKIWFEQRRQVMFQLHLSDKQFYWLLRCVLHQRFNGNSLA